MKMQITATVGGSRYAVNLQQPRDISIPLRFQGPQLRLFGAPPACSEPYSVSGFVGDVRQGGSCNCETFTFAAHLNGTHTECIGHIANARIALPDILHDSLIPVTLVSVAPQMPQETNDSYDPALRPQDKLITRDALEQAFKDRDAAFFEGVVIRTIPNDTTKITQDYDQVHPAFFSMEAIRFLTEIGVDHLLTDLPSIDRLDDDGKLTNHHIYWDVPPGHHPLAGEKSSLRTITELIYVADEMADGIYVLNLQIAPFMADASPSRPILYELNRL